jgi:hypothetical protein
MSRMPSSANGLTDPSISPIPISDISLHIIRSVHGQASMPIHGQVSSTLANEEAGFRRTQTNA